MFTICVLCFGDYPQLARRCLDSLRQLPREQFELRIGLNNCCRETCDYVDGLIDKGWLSADALSLGDASRYKYPTMRDLFYAKPLTTEWTMWFDDDSFLREGTGENWLALVANAGQSADMLGSIYAMQLGGRQHEWIQRQPWYTGQPVLPAHTVRFATGGWWTIRTKLLQSQNWPVPELVHRGGDVMLGEVCRQQRWRLAQFNNGIAINADATGRESKSTTRGFNSKPIGW